MNNHQERNQIPSWYDYAAIVGMLILCLFIVLGGIIIESTRPTSPNDLLSDPKATHVRIYHENELMGIKSWTDSDLNITVDSLVELELWYFRLYLNGYSNKDMFETPSKMTLKYTVDEDYKNNNNWDFLKDLLDNPVHPVKRNDIKGLNEVMGYFFNLTIYFDLGYIDNWTNGSSIYFALSIKKSTWNYHITTPTNPIKIEYLITNSD